MSELTVQVGRIRDLLKKDQMRFEVMRLELRHHMELEHPENARHVEEEAIRRAEDLAPVWLERLQSEAGRGAISISNLLFAGQVAISRLRGQSWSREDLRHQKLALYRGIRIAEELIRLLSGAGAEVAASVSDPRAFISSHHDDPVRFHYVHLRLQVTVR